MRGSATPPGPPVSHEHLDQVVSATRLVGALIAESLANLRPAVTTPQWRVVVLAAEGSCNVSAVAEDLGVHRSNATRVCDRLVAAGLLERRRAQRDRRHVLLALTPAGRQLYDHAMDYRRRRLGDAMAQMTAEERAELARCFARLVEADAQARANRRTEG
jgi:DNA-binding MarR family transcriptional regulator